MTLIQRLVAELKWLRSQGVAGAVRDEFEIDGVTYTVVVNEKEED